MVARPKLVTEKPTETFEVVKGQSLFVTGQRKYLSYLPDGWRKRFLYWWFVEMGRYFYFKWGVCPVIEENGKGEISFDSWREGVGVWPTKEEADATHEDENWFTQELRFRESAASETAQIGYHSFSKSPARRRYEKRNLDSVSVSRQTLQMFDRDLDKVNESLKT